MFYVMAAAGQAYIVTLGNEKGRSGQVDDRHAPRRRPVAGRPERRRNNPPLKRPVFSAAAD